MKNITRPTSPTSLKKIDQYDDAFFENIGSEIGSNWFGIVRSHRIGDEMFEGVAKTIYL